MISREEQKILVKDNEYHGSIYTNLYKTDSQWKFNVWLKEFWNNLEGWESVGREKEIQEGGEHVQIWLIHVNVWQQSKQYCKAIINQLKINTIFKKDS